MKWMSVSEIPLGSGDSRRSSYTSFSTPRFWRLYVRGNVGIWIHFIVFALLHLRSAGECWDLDYGKQVCSRFALGTL